MGLTDKLTFQNSEFTILNSVDVVVTGIGLSCCLGSLAESWQRLVAGESGIQLARPFPELPAYPLGRVAASPTTLRSLADSVVTAALKDAGLTPPLLDCGIAIGSSRGCQGLWERWSGKQQGIDFLASNSDRWLDTLPHQGAIAAAQYLGTTGPLLAPMAACATGIWAITQGYELIQQGRCQRVLAGAIEAPITPLTLAGFQQMGALARTGCYPFDRQREGLVLAEGGAILVLESAELALRRSPSIYGQILGFGLTCDAQYLSAPADPPRSALSAIAQCLQRSRLKATEIDYIHAHGTSTHLNDLTEATLIQALFPHKVAVSSTKGATGHTLGASGAIGVAFCLLALKHQQFPPCVGLREPAFPLNLVTQARQAKIRQALCFSFGFGGQNAIMALGRYEGC